MYQYDTNERRHYHKTYVASLNLIYSSIQLDQQQINMSTKRIVVNDVPLIIVFLNLKKKKSRHRVQNEKNVLFV